MGNMISMGGHASAGDAGNVDAYVSRLSDSEVKRYTDGYRRICRVEGSLSSSATITPAPFLHRASSSASNGSNSNLTGAPAVVAATEAANGPQLSKKLFRSKVLGAFSMIPHSLSDRLFEVLDTDHSGELSLLNVLSGLAWLKHGTYEEQVQLLFIIYDLDNAGEISREVLDRFMDVIYGRKRARHSTTVKFLDGVFAGRATLDLHEFRQIVQEKDEHGDALLVKWLSVLAAKIGIEDDPQILALEKTYNPVAIRRRIAQSTLFSLTEVTSLERQFQKICATNSSNEDAEQEEERQVEEISATQTAEAGWDEEAFTQWATEAVAVRRLLNQLAFAACIVFGLKPESAYLEKKIVEWHWREATRTFGIGQTWNLMGAEWWHDSFCCLYGFVLMLMVVSFGLVKRFY
eukprot:jgi/Phyca11/17277/fgenesh1_pg.PHYCAscaffold_26_\